MFHKYFGAPFSVLLAIVVLALGARMMSAQQPRTGVVVISVEESMGMVREFVVRSAGRTARTDSAGHARLMLPEGRQVVSVTGMGIKPAQIDVIVVADSTVTAKVAVEMGGMVMEAVKVSATRIERLAGDAPVRVEVVSALHV